MKKAINKLSKKAVHGLATFMLTLSAWLLLGSILSHFDTDDHNTHNHIKASHSSVESDYYAKVEKHLKEGVVKYEMTQDAAKAQLLAERNLDPERYDYEDYIVANTRAADGLDLNQEKPFSVQAIEEANAERIELTPEQRIQYQVAIRQYAENYDEDMTRAYVEALVANARKQGYKIRLNKNLEVVGIQEIRKAQPIEL